MNSRFSEQNEGDEFIDKYYELVRDI